MISHITADLSIGIVTSHGGTETYEVPFYRRYKFLYFAACCV